jgi:hypothetical protein
MTRVRNPRKRGTGFVAIARVQLEGQDACDKAAVWARGIRLSYAGTATNSRSLERIS